MEVSQTFNFLAKSLQEYSDSIGARLELAKKTAFDGAVRHFTGKIKWYGMLTNEVITAFRNTRMLLAKNFRRLESGIRKETTEAAARHVVESRRHWEIR